MQSVDDVLSSSLLCVLHGNIVKPFVFLRVARCERVVSFETSCRFLAVQTFVLGGRARYGRSRQRFPLCKTYSGVIVTRSFVMTVPRFTCVLSEIAFPADFGSRRCALSFLLSLLLRLVLRLLRSALLSNASRSSVIFVTVVAVLRDKIAEISPHARRCVAGGLTYRR